MNARSDTRAVAISNRYATDKRTAAAVSDSQKEFFKTKSPITLYVFGGTGAVCDRTIKW